MFDESEKEPINQMLRMTLADEEGTAVVAAVPSRGDEFQGGYDSEGGRGGAWGRGDRRGRLTVSSNGRGTTGDTRDVGSGERGIDATRDWERFVASLTRCSHCGQDGQRAKDQDKKMLEEYAGVVSSRFSPETTDVRLMGLRQVHPYPLPTNGQLLASVPRSVRSPKISPSGHPKHAT